MNLTFRWLQEVMSEKQGHLQEVLLKHNKTKQYFISHISELWPLLSYCWWNFPVQLRKQGVVWKLWWKTPAGLKMCHRSYEGPEHWPTPVWPGVSLQTSSPVHSKIFSKWWCRTIKDSKYRLLNLRRKPVVTENIVWYYCSVKSLLIWSWYISDQLQW